MTRQNATRWMELILPPLIVGAMAIGGHALITWRDVGRNDAVLLERLDNIRDSVTAEKAGAKELADKIERQAGTNAAQEAELEGHEKRISRLEDGRAKIN